MGPWLFIWMKWGSSRFRNKKESTNCCVTLDNKGPRADTGRRGYRNNPEDTVWGDGFIKGGGNRYGKREVKKEPTQFAGRWDVWHLRRMLWDDSNAFCLCNGNNVVFITWNNMQRKQFWGGKFWSSVWTCWARDTCFAFECKYTYLELGSIIELEI